MNKLELKKNIFIRTKDGIIDKVTIDYKGKCNSPNCICKHVSCQYNYYDEVDIINASYNIIDLIEVGDYVNGIPVEDITRFKDGTWYITFDEWRWIDNNVNAIETIVTKEQFSSMEYRLGDK